MSKESVEKYLNEIDKNNGVGFGEEDRKTFYPNGTTIKKTDSEKVRGDYVEKLLQQIEKGSFLGE